ncbi:MAG: sulfur carrier protein ThiS [Ottowia sp.]|nr:sulfur carrier protein ThiS [Ottowia sp.]
MSSKDRDASTITVQLDGQPHEVRAGTTLAQLVHALGHEPQAISTAVNGSFVARSARDRVLGSNDVVLFFQPVVGG